jgi:DNA polymerase V
MSLQKHIPIESIALDEEGQPIPPGLVSRCEEKEPYALMVLGDRMEPEFREGEVLVIEPQGHVYDGAWVIAWHNNEHIFRQLRIRADRWFIMPLNDRYPTHQLDGPTAIKGVVVQKKSPGGGRRNIKFYDPPDASA